jgi:hypothetical protein
MSRPLSEIAVEIVREWPKPAFSAVPYLGAMMTLTSIDDYYFQDSARSIVGYFLVNAKTWRGEAARRIKQELRTLVG